VLPVRVKTLRFNTKKYVGIGADRSKTSLKVQTGEKEQIMVTKPKQ